MFNRFIAYILQFFPKRFIWLFSKKYIAGETLEEAINSIEALHQQSVDSTIDILGESVNNPEEVHQYQLKYQEAINTLSKHSYSTTFSLKPSMFGLKWDADLCYETLLKLVALANEHHCFIRIDMEDSSCTQAELELFKKLYLEFPKNVGIVLQAYLRRTLDDLDYLKKFALPENPISIRLCKGIYNEPARIAYKSKQAIRDNFRHCLVKMMQYGFYPAIATHDALLISESIKLIEKFKLQKNQYEFQMLLGVTPRLRQKLVNENRVMRVYVPYGVDWFNYSIRRLQENPRMVWDIIGSFFTRK